MQYFALSTLNLFNLFKFYAIKKGGGVPQFGERRGTVKKHCLVSPSKKICPKCILLGTSGVIWGDLGTFWSDFSDFRLQSQSVL